MRIHRLGAALLVAGVAACPFTAAAKDRVVQIELLVQGDSVTVLSMEDAPMWTKESLPRKPQITEKSWRKIEHDQSELLVVLHDEKGKVFQNYAYPGRYVAFLETIAGSEKGQAQKEQAQKEQAQKEQAQKEQAEKEQAEKKSAEKKSAEKEQASKARALKGGFATPSYNVRTLFLALPKKTAFISFYRSEVRHFPMGMNQEAFDPERFHAMTFESKSKSDGSGRPGDAVGFGWNLLGLYPVPRTPKGQPPKPFDMLEVPRTLKFSGFPKKLPPNLGAKLHPDKAKKATMSTVCSGPGTVTGHVQIFSATAPVTPGNRNFNIVIFGDGFTSSVADVSRYQIFADRAAQAFHNVPPFSDHFPNINLWRIDTASDNSGIANCPNMPCPEPRVPADTYYRMSGCMTPAGGLSECDVLYAGYIGPEVLCPLNFAARQELGEIYIDLRLVIVNCDIYGGAAYPADRLAVIPAYDSMDFPELVLHESAHVVGGLCDEYWVCVNWEGESFPNFATIEQVNDGGVPWRALDPWWALNKHIRGVAPCSATGTDHNYDFCAGVDSSGPGPIRGAFWGCQFFDPAYVPSDCCSLDCADWQVASTYFRPSPQCKMKALYWPFCFACSDAVGNRVRNPPPLIFP
jgi:hypothetical protein